MSKTIVSILSDHLLPNFLFIKEMEGQYSDLLFVSTPQMEMQEKAMHLEVALGRKEGSVRRIVVANDNYKEILDRPACGATLWQRGVCCQHNGWHQDYVARCA